MCAGLKISVAYVALRVAFLLVVGDNRVGIKSIKKKSMIIQILIASAPFSAIPANSNDSK